MVRQEHLTKKFNEEGSTYHRVNKTDKEDRVEKIGLHLGTLGNCPGDNRREGACKSKLEEPTFILDVTISEKESSVSNKCLGTTLLVASVRKSISTAPECQTTGARIKKIPQNDILHVFCSDTSGAKHSKSSLHEIHKGTLVFKGEKLSAAWWYMYIFDPSMMSTYRKDQVECIYSRGKTGYICASLLCIVERESSRK